MPPSVPTPEAIATQLRELSRMKGAPITEREWCRHPERLCGATTILRLFQRPWNEILRTCGITPRDPKSPEYVAQWILAFYAEQQRWPQRRDFHRPCSHWLVKRVFHDRENALAAAVQRAKDTLKTLEAQGVVLAEYLASHFITVTPQPLPARVSVPAMAVIYGTPTGYELFPFAPQFEVGVVSLFSILVGGEAQIPLHSRESQPYSLSRLQSKAIRPRTERVCRCLD